MEGAAPQSWRARPVFIYGVTLLVTAVIAIITVLLTSDVSDLGMHMHDELDSFPHLREVTAGVSALLVLMLLLGYIFDVACWESHTCLRAMYLLWLGILIFVVLLLVTPMMPVAPIFGGLMVTAVAWRFEKSLFHFKNSEGLLLRYLKAVSRSSLLVAALLVVLWVVWLVTGIEEVPDFTQQGRGDSVNTVNPQAALVRFAAPLLMAFDLVIIYVCVSIRAQFETSKHDMHHHSLPLSNYLHVYLILLIVLMFTGYMAVALSSYSHIAGTTVLFFCAVSAVLILTYMGFMIGSTRILEIAKLDNFANSLITFLHGNYVKAGIVLAVLPVSPIIFAVDACHQMARKGLWRNGILKDDPGCTALTQEMKTVLAWELTSIFPLSMCMGVAIVILRLFAAFIPPLMALLNLQLASQSWVLVLVVSFVVAIVLFLLPPVSGQMIYIPISMMIIGKWGVDTYAQLTAAVVVATAFCLMLKMVGSALQQKAIGEPLSRSIAVKKAFGLHTTAFRVARFVLSQQGCSLQKSILLTGMPDWPISVLCGVLGLPLLPIMLSTLPEVIKILPNCAAVGFILKARDVSGSSLVSTFDSLAGVCFGLGVAIPAGLTVIVSFIVKRLVVEHQEEFSNANSTWHRDPQEAEILAAIEKDNIEDAEVKRLTHWGVQPCWARAVLLVGSLLATLATATNLLTPFESFDFQDPDAIHDLPGDSVAGLIRAPGYAMLALASATCLCLAAYQSRHLLVVRKYRAQERSEEDSWPDTAI